MRRIKQEKILTKILVGSIIFILIGILFLYVYITYKNIVLDERIYTAIKTQCTAYAESVDSIQDYSQTIADVIEETNKKVVGISKLQNLGNTIFSKSQENELGLGTGFIVSENGYIISNAHVAGEKFSRCYVTLENGINYDGKVVWSDSNLDLAVVKIEAKNLPCVVLGDSSKIRVGETVYAIGNPIGYEFRRTVTSGIISAKNRTIKIDEKDKSSYMTDLIQTDATINPGNSGGPLIYPNGDVIGINTVKISSAEGIGFAIPINIIKQIIQSYKDTGDFQEATIGIYAYDKEVIPYLNNAKVATFEKGIYVAQITPNGPADNTELKENDIITSIDNVEINTMNSLREYIFTKKPGDEVTLKVTKGKVNKEVKIVLGKK